jgi:hypothetical protein
VQLQPGLSQKQKKRLVAAKKHEKKRFELAIAIFSFVFIAGDIISIERGVFLSLHS